MKEYQLLVNTDAEHLSDLVTNRLAEQPEERLKDGSTWLLPRWELHGNPIIAFVESENSVYFAQAVTREVY